jgi:hypothetical protein
MKSYHEFRPTGFDPAGLCEDVVGPEWLVLPCSLTRDSGALGRSNFRIALDRLGGESETVAVHRFGHWGCGWFEIIVVQPNTPAASIAETIEQDLENYPCLNEEDFAEEQHDEANQVWKNCYNTKERIQYIREHRTQFEFHDMKDLLGCVRGGYFAGYACELL